MIIDQDQRSPFIVRYCAVLELLWCPCRFILSSSYWLYLFVPASFTSNRTFTQVKEEDWLQVEEELSWTPAWVNAAKGRSAERGAATRSLSLPTASTAACFKALLSVLSHSSSDKKPAEREKARRRKKGRNVVGSFVNWWVLICHGNARYWILHQSLAQLSID